MKVFNETINVVIIAGASGIGKEIAKATEGLSVQEGFRVMREGGLSAYGRVYASEDAEEGMAALAEKRAPNWKGR